jgi:hypothetical protein
VKRNDVNYTVRLEDKLLLPQKEISNVLGTQVFSWKISFPFVIIVEEKAMGEVNVLNLLKVTRSVYLMNLIGDRQRMVPLVCCINCGEEGHRMRDCPKERNEFHSAMVCHNCKFIPPTTTLSHNSESGHLSRDCPTKASGCRNCGFICPHPLPH